jgi:hypothetical protein
MSSEREEKGIYGHTAIAGNLRGLTSTEICEYYNNACEELGLNPDISPIGLIFFYGKRGFGKAAIVDIEDLDSVRNYKWFFATNGYAITNILRPGEAPLSIRLHKIILSSPDKMDTDHRNKNKLDNRSSNLRIATRTQNNANRDSHRVGDRQYKGVQRSRRKWQARIGFEGKGIFLGSFSSAEAAALAYNEAAKEYFGEFARLNQIGDSK